MNHGAAALQLCEKLSQQMQGIFKEAEQKKDQLQELRSQNEASRLKTNQLLAPSFSASRLQEIRLNAEAYRATSREIEGVRRHYEEYWRSLPRLEDLKKEIDLLQDKLIRQEEEINQLRKDKLSSMKLNKDLKPSLIDKYTEKLHSAKSQLDKLERMKNRFERTVDEVISSGSQATNYLAEFKTRFENHQKLLTKIHDIRRSVSTTVLALENSKKNDEYTDESPRENYDEFDEEILKERLRNERESNKQLETLLVYAQNWLLQEESFEKEIHLLDTTQ